MRYKGLSVCLIALVVFFGLRSLMRTVEPKAPSRLAMLEDGTPTTPSRNHLASFASLAAGALAFAIIPGPTKRRNGPVPRLAPYRAHLAALTSLAAGALAAIPSPAKRRNERPAVPTPAVAPAPAQEPVVRCPQCDRTMDRVLISTGEHRGRTVWLCPQSPDCEVRPLTRRRRLSFVHHAS